MRYGVRAIMNDSPLSSRNNDYVAHIQILVHCYCSKTIFERNNTGEIIFVRQTRMYITKSYILSRSNGKLRQKHMKLVVCHRTMVAGEKIVRKTKFRR